MEEQFDLETIKAAMKLCMEKSFYDELLFANRLVEQHVGRNRGVELSEALATRDPDLTSILIVSLPRSGSTYLRDSLISTWGHRNFICYDGHDGDFTRMDGVYSKRLGSGGLIARTHSEPTADELEQITAGAVRKIVLLIRHPVQAAISLARRRAQTAAIGEKELSALVRSNIGWLSGWHSIVMNETHRFLVLKYEEIVHDWPGAIRLVGAFHNLPDEAANCARIASMNRHGIDQQVPDLAMSPETLGHLLQPISDWYAR